MNKVANIESRFGFIEIFINQKKNLLYAVPNGYVGPELVKKDLKFLEHFDAACEDNWTYIVDISKVKLVNPINPFLLKRLRQFSKMKEYIVYAPSPIIRIMLNLNRWIIKPDKIIKENNILQKELKK